MSLPTPTRLAIGVGLVAAVTVGAAIGRAQLTPVAPVTPFIVPSTNTAFEVTGSSNGVPVGRIVIRKDATSPWTPVQLSRWDVGVKRID